MVEGVCVYDLSVPKLGPWFIPSTVDHTHQWSTSPTRGFGTHVSGDYPRCRQNLDVHPQVVVRPTSDVGG